MIRDCLDAFTHQYNKQGDKLFFQDYMLKPGYYFLLDMEGNLIDSYYKSTSLKIDFTNVTYSKFCKYHYYTFYLDSNSAIEKKLMSCSPYGLIISRKRLEYVKEEHVEKYFNYFLDPVNHLKKYKLTYYQHLQATLNPLDRDLVTTCKSILSKAHERIPELLEQAGFTLNNSWHGINIFVDVPLEYYQESYTNFVRLNMVSSAEYNRYTDTEILGVPKQDFTLTTKKSTLCKYSRPCAYPQLMPVDQIYYRQLFYNYLLKQYNCGKRMGYFTDTEMHFLSFKENAAFERTHGYFSGYFIAFTTKDGVAHVYDARPISRISNYITPCSLNPYFLKAFSQAYIDKTMKPYGVISTMSELRNYIEQVLFRGYLPRHYNTPAEDNHFKGLPIVYRQSLLHIRDILKSWFFTGNRANISAILFPYATTFINYHIKQAEWHTAREQWQVADMLKDYFDYQEGSVGQFYTLLYHDIEHMLNGTVGGITCDEQYYIAMGQAFHYLITQSESAHFDRLSGKITSYYSPAQMQRGLHSLYDKYNYKLFNPKFQQLYTMLTNYTPSSATVNDCAYQYGLLAVNLMYLKKINIPEECISNGAN